MPAITVKQPGASLILHHGKDVENRPKAWPSTIKLPVRVLVVAGKGQWSKAEKDSQREGLLHAFGADGAAKFMMTTRLDAFPAGAALGTVEVTACVTDSPSPWAIAGQHHYLLRDPQPFAAPIPFPASRRGIFQAPTVAALQRPHDGSTRRVDVREELADVMITRNAGPWGNPYKVVKKRGRTRVFWEGGYSNPVAPEKALRFCLAGFEDYLRNDEALMARLPELKGKRLGCFCRADQPCHGDVLVKLVKEVCGK